MQALTDNELRDIDKGLIMIRLIWIGLLIALGVYVVIANILGEGMISDPDDPADSTFVTMGYVLYVIGAMLLTAVYFLRRSVTKRNGVFSRIAGYTTPTASSTMATSGINPGSAVGRYIGGLIICFGLIESIGIFGLILFMVNNSFLDLYLLNGIAFAAQLYVRPRKQELIDLTVQLKENIQTH